MRLFIGKRAVGLLLLAFLLASAGAENSANAGLIRDAEVENTIRAYATPLFGAAGLNPEDVRIFIIRDDSLNAFVAGGMNLFVHSGLLIGAKNANQLIGVIAHETGHIAGGHLAKLAGRLRQANRTALISTILGVITAAASGSAEAGSVITRGGQGAALGGLLAFNRAQESAADQAALQFLNDTGQSPRGIANFLRTLEHQELLSVGRQDPYVRTHPITRERIDHVENALRTSQFANSPESPEFRRMFVRMVAKLKGFLAPPARTLADYKEGDRSVAARYGRAIALFRLADIDRAVALMDGLIAEEPKNPWFHELKGQILFESGRITAAVTPYEKAVRLAPREPLIRIALASAQLETGQKALLPKALANLREAMRHETRYAYGWRQLAIAYGRSGSFGLSALAQAEEALARGRRKEAIAQARRAERKLKKGSAAWLRAQDIKRTAAEKNG